MHELLVCFFPVNIVPLWTSDWAMMVLFDRFANKLLNPIVCRFVDFFQ